MTFKGQISMNNLLSSGGHVLGYDHFCKRSDDAIVQNIFKLIVLYSTSKLNNVHQRRVPLNVIDRQHFKWGQKESHIY